MPNSQRDRQPWTDEIVAEVRSAREELFATCNYDLNELAQRLRATEVASGRAVVPSRKPSRPVPA